MVKTIAVEDDVWFSLRSLEKFPERSKVSDVIKFLLKEYDEKEHTKELLK